MQSNDNEAGKQENAGDADGYTQMTEKQRNLFELQLKMVCELLDSIFQVDVLLSVIIHLLHV
jgi:hypothetical protein